MARKRRKQFTKGQSVPAPTDEIRIAIEAGALVTGADPEDIMSGKKGSRAEFDRPISTARAYAALALRAMYPDNNTSAYGPWVKAEAGYMSNLDHSIKHDRVSWWNSDKFISVIEAIERFQEEKKARRASPNPFDVSAQVEAP